MHLGHRVANERGHEWSGRQGDLRDVVRVPREIRSPFTDVGTQQLVERPVGADLVLEHRAVVGCSGAGRRRPRPATGARAGRTRLPVATVRRAPSRPRAMPEGARVWCNRCGRRSPGRFARPGGRAVDRSAPPRPETWIAPGSGCPRWPGPEPGTRPMPHGVDRGPGTARRRLASHGPIRGPDTKCPLGRLLHQHRPAEGSGAVGETTLCRMRVRTTPRGY